MDLLRVVPQGDRVYATGRDVPAKRDRCVRRATCRELR